MKTPATILSILILALFSCKQNDRPDTKKPDTEDLLWYRSPATAWIEALPLGNGRIGAMVFGDPHKERIQLNDDSMWSGAAEWDEPLGRPGDLQQIRRLLMEGDHAEADRQFVERFSNKRIVRSHQTLGELFIEMDSGQISDYRRELNLSKALCTVSYKRNGHAFSECVLASHPDQVIAIRLNSEDPEGFDARLMLERPDDEGIPTVKTWAGENCIYMEGEVTQHGGLFRSEAVDIDHGVRFRSLLKVDHQGGQLTTDGQSLSLEGVRQATLYFVNNSSWYGEDFKEKGAKQLLDLEHCDFEELLARHIQDHQSYYNRTRLHLSGERYKDRPTDERLARLRDGFEDAALSELLFNYGRYLLIASSRPGSNPANLQGLWNEHINAPWNADYHLNINLQMNYWLADICGLSELNEPLYAYIDRLIERGKKTAMTNFGCRGSFLPHATDLWAPTWLRAPTAYWGCSMAAGGWMLQHYWTGFEYNRDTSFLRNRVFPALEQVALFYSDWLIEDPRDGSLVSAPSTSPENRFITAKGDTVASCMGSAMDQQVIAEVFSHYLEACKILGIESELHSSITRQQKKLRPGFVIGKDGRILEWDSAYREPEPGHRHMSQVYGFHPGTDVSPETSPEIFEAIRKTLDYRLANGGAGTGWSRAWLINLSARLLEGEMAYEHIGLMFRKSISDNLFDMHPPFQIDGNFGFSSGLAEMLLQSHEKDILRILPALPKAWPDGYVLGLQARGGMSLDIEWKDGRASSVRIHSLHNNRFTMKVNGLDLPVSIAKGDTFEWKN